MNNGFVHFPLLEKGMPRLPWAMALSEVQASEWVQSDSLFRQ